ncbi:MAG: DUF5723 family protein [Bacillota bacterium]
MKKLIVLVIAIMLAAVMPVNANSPVSFFSGETDNIDRNPAMLSLTDYDFALQLNPLYGGAYNNAWTFNQVFENMNEYLDDSRKRDILGSISDNGFGIGAELNSGLAFGRNDWGLRTGLKSYAAASIDKEVFEYILEGMATDAEPSIDLRLDNTRFNARAVVDTGYARGFAYEDIAEQIGSEQLDEMLTDWESFYVGFGVHHLLGLANVEGGLTGNANFEFTDETRIKVDGRMQFDYTTPADDGLGQGLAMDFGFWGSPNPDWEVGFAVNNLGFVRWPSATRYSYEEEINVKLESADQLEDGYIFVDSDGNKIDDFDSLIESDEVTEERIGSYMTASPVTIQADAVYDAHPNIDLGGSVGFHQAPRNNLSLAFASKFTYPEFMPVTLGITYDTFRRNISLPFRIGFRTEHWDILNLYVSDLRMIPAHGRGLTVGFSSGFRF